MLERVSVDVLSPDIIYGWADYRDRTDPLSLCLFVNDVHAVTFVCDVFRQDLKDEGFINYNSGFQVPIGPFLMPGVNNIEIVESSRSRSLYKAQVSTISPEMKVCVGKEGYLFVEKTIDNNVFDELMGRETLVEFLRKKYHFAFSFRKAIFESAGIQYYHCVIPDKASFIGERLIEGFELSIKRPSKVIEKIARERLGARAFEIDLDRWAKDTTTEQWRSSFTKTDSHFTTVGGGYVFSKIIDHINDQSDFKIASQIHLPESLQRMAMIGDLSASCGVKEPEWLHEPSYLKDIYDVYRKEIVDEKVVTYARSSREISRRVTIVGTSSSARLAPFFFANFGNVQHVNSLNVPFEVIMEFRPDIVVHLPAERMVNNVPIDVLVAKKKSAS